MGANTLKNAEWFRDEAAYAAGEPGIVHSFPASLASALRCMGAEVDPVTLMGASGFAFRIFVNETFCPSAMRVFDWRTILPESVAQLGFGCEQVLRLWEEGALEAERRHEAQSAIVRAIDAGRPAIVWDFADAEWGLLTGYDDGAAEYSGFDRAGKPARLAYGKLGQNEIQVLAVTLPGAPNGRSPEEIFRNSLRTAVAHAEQAEWMERPRYQDGLPAYELWATLHDRGALLLDAGKGEDVPAEVWKHANYYAKHHYSARCYARDFLDAAAVDAAEESPLARAADAYAEVADHLRPVWLYFAQGRHHEAAVLNYLAGEIRAAGEAEARGIAAITEYLEASEVPPGQEVDDDQR